MVGFQALSSFMVGFIHLTDPPTGLRLVIGLFALSNTLIGWWLMARLWRDSDSKHPNDSP